MIVTLGMKKDAMDINPLIADINQNKDELTDCVMLAIGFNELNEADVHVALAIAEINGERYSDHPFQQISTIYRLPISEVVNNIRDFTNKAYKSIMPGDPQHIQDIDFITEI